MFKAAVDWVSECRKRARFNKARKLLQGTGFSVVRILKKRKHTLSGRRGRHNSCYWQGVNG